MCIYYTCKQYHTRYLMESPCTPIVIVIDDIDSLPTCVIMCVIFSHYHSNTGFKSNYDIFPVLFPLCKMLKSYV